MSEPAGTVRERVDTQKQDPTLYKVVLLNDDYTTMEFVVTLLESVFQKSPAEAYQIMMQVHRHGRGIAGTYPWEVAETKVATVLSLDPKVDPDIPAMLGSSAALAVSGIPFNGPIGAARVGYRDGQYVLNPSFKDLEDSLLDLVVAGTDTSVLMVESEARELPEDIMLGAVLFGHQQLQTAINAIRELAKAVGTKPWDWTPPAM